MSVDEELQEHAHHAHDPFDKRVAAVMAIVAALLAIVTVLGQHFNTEKLLEQQKASDQWAYAQAKDIRRYTAQMAGDLLTQIKGDPKVAQKYLQDAERYKKDHEKISESATEFEHSRDKMGSEADSFHFGEVFLEVSIVLSSLAILTKRNFMFGLAIVSAVIGIAISVGGWYLYGVLGHV